GLLAEVDEAHETMSGPRLRAESGGHAENPIPGVSRIWGSGLRTAVPNFGTSHLQPAQAWDVPEKTGGLSGDQASVGEHRRETETRSTRPARLPASGHRASRRPRWRQRGLPHQCRG